MTDPTREAFPVDAETINLALDAWFAGDCSRPHYDEDIDQMRAAASVIVAALSARAQGEAVATVEKTRCGCHPETCCCGDYTLRINGRYVACGSQKNMREIADAINATPAAHAVDVDELVAAAREIKFDVYALTTPELRAIFDGRESICVLQYKTINRLKAALAQQGREVVYQCPRCATSMQIDPTAKPYVAPKQQAVDVDDAALDRAVGAWFGMQTHMDEVDPNSHEWRTRMRNAIAALTQPEAE